MTRITRMWRNWVAFTAQRETGTALACFRIAVGLVMLVSIGSVVARGLVAALWYDASAGGILSGGRGFWAWSLVGGPTPTGVQIAVVASLLASVLMVLGLGGRATIVAALLAYRALATLGPSGGYDGMIVNGAWLLVLSQSTATLSLDCRLRSDSWCSATRVPAWPRYVAILQLVVIYLFTGLQKGSASWNPSGGYSALYWVLRDPTWIRFNNDWAAHAYPLTQLGTATVWHWELAAPLLLLVYYYRNTRERRGRLRALFNRRDLRIPWAVVGATMHIGILVLMEMGPFSWISLSYYLCLWQPAELEKLAARAWRRVRGTNRTAQTGSRAV